MALMNGFENPALYRGGYVAIGNFDGVHRGHQSMIARLAERARQANVPAIVLTFDPHPIMKLKPDLAPPRLTALQTKSDLLHHYGVDHVIAYPTDQELLNLLPEEFFEKFLLEELKVRGLVEGPNFFFGRNRSGNVETLRELCEPHQLSLDVIPAFKWKDVHVSSSAIRKLISEGDLHTAIDMLGHGYPIVGDVTSGEGRGRGLGFPTANLSGVSTLLPSDGVYAGHCTVEGTRFCAAVNIGPNPTFKTKEHKIEVHLLDFSGDLYGQSLTVELNARVRDTRTFDSVEELKQQISADLDKVRQFGDDAD
ncbi:Riboflavin kinase [Polystyrenella longa]|uniref:Riboflavin biosynthesis protein n=1 Tax=Polystyrenella longa TaxID=2528007 RepID=A0A518CPA4_9PLAN|nr:bifunctional riboflavin kinase/FAD synthetase [Polystyrenella longa]QDU81056.1 Riboflavin kinase [Polystyrenella longa]